jgi:5'-nucleotidase/UDP-sugar diphosphatase
MAYRAWCLPLAALVFGAACATTPASTGSEPADPGAAAATPETPAAPAPDPKTARIKVVGISDFHGWLRPLEPKRYTKFYGGIANIAAMIRGRDKVTDLDGLILDNGDMWTGPTESTLLRGESVIQAYNALGLTAANVANHEFDYGLEILKARVGEAKFPFLGANIVAAGTDTRPSWVKPWIIEERDGVKVGIIGLSYAKTPQTTLAPHVQGLEFKPYGETLAKLVPELRAAGAELLVVLFHDTVDEIEKVLLANPGLGLNVVIAGQNHRKGHKTVDGALVVNPGPFGRSYVRFDVEVDRASRAVTRVAHEIVDVEGEVGAPEFAPDARLVAIAESAMQKAQTLSGEVLGDVAGPLPVGTFENTPLGHMIVDAWLATFPQVDVAIMNHGSLRQPLGAGPITIGDLTSVLPFENNLFIVKVSGKQLKQQLAIDHPIVSGVTWKYEGDEGKRTVTAAFDRRGKPIEDAKIYAVVINDFMYYGGDGYAFKDLDATPEDTGLSWREPPMRTLRLAKQGGRAVPAPAGARAARGK